jgi:hypothetical protein
MADQDDQFWLNAGPWMLLLFWVAATPYLAFPLFVALLISGVALAVMAAVIWWRRSTVRRRVVDARRREMDAQLDRARWALMTHLTEADEHWLAERHFWVVPVQVALLRAGLDPRPERREIDLPLLDWRQRRELHARSDAARAAFEGIRRTQAFVESEWGMAS